MSLEELLKELTDLQVTLGIEGGRIWYQPRSLVGPDLLARLIVHKPELLERLSRSGSVEPDPVIHLGHPTDDEPLGPDAWPVGSVDPDEIPVCPTCGLQEAWQSVAGDRFGLTPGVWNCIHCDPPAAANRLRAHTARILRRRNRGSAPGQIRK